VASYRRPKGTYVRSTQDWFSDRIFTGGWAAQNDPLVNNGTYFSVSLYNNDQTGRLYYVYRLTIASDSAQFYYASLHSGKVGSQVANCFSINPQLGYATGQIYLLTQTGTAGPPWLPNPTDPFVTFAASGAMAGAAGESPAFILPVGDSLVIRHNQSGNQYAVSFWFVPLAGN